jgi:hypothetical protein
MDIDRTNRIPNRHVTSNNLEKRVSSLATALSGGRWFGYKAEGIEVTHTYIERDDYESIDDMHVAEHKKVEPIYTSVSLGFIASREVVTHEGEIYSVPEYVISSTVTQEVHKSEIPEAVLDEIFKEGQESDYGEDSGDNLDEFTLKRVQKLTYSIDNQGEIEEYELSYSYLVGDSVVHSAVYSEMDDRFTMEAVRDSNGTAVERKPRSTVELTSDEINEYIASLDSHLERFMLEELEKEKDHVVGMSKEEHIKRALGMIGMISSGYTKRRWYNGVYDYLLHRRQR